MPMQRDRYPPDWPEIAKQAKDRAGWMCEACGIEHGTLRLNAKGKMFREIMTTAHLGTMHGDGSPGDKSDKFDCRPENLASLCTRCHLELDLEDHVANRMENLRRKKLAQLQALYGNGFLFELNSEENREGV